MPSEQFKLNSDDFRRWINNAGIFLAPLVLIYLTPVTENLQDGIQLLDFVPSPLVQGAMVLYLVNTLTDLVRKFTAGKQP